MVKAEQSATRHRPRSAQLMETNYFAIVAVRTQTHSLAIAFDHAESEDILIELERAIEISDLQADAAETSGIR